MKATRPDQLAHTLAVMQDPETVGHDSMPPIESSVAALIVSPNEVLCENVRCPNAECMHTDELLSRAQMLQQAVAVFLIFWRICLWLYNPL